MRKKDDYKVNLECFRFVDRNIRNMFWEDFISSANINEMVSFPEYYWLIFFILFFLLSCIVFIVSAALIRCLFDCLKQLKPKCEKGSAKIDGVSIKISKILHA